MCVRARACTCVHTTVGNLASRATGIRRRSRRRPARKFRTAVAVRRDKPPFGRDDPVKAKELSRRRSRSALSTTRSGVILRRCFWLLIIRHYATYRVSRFRYPIVAVGRRRETGRKNSVRVLRARHGNYRDINERELLEIDRGRNGA